MDNTLFPKMYPYEGFGGRAYSSLDYSSNPQQQAMDSYSSLLINDSASECRKVFGFDGLFCKPYLADGKIDIYSGAEGSFSCSGSGLTNSKGSLCLDKNQTNMLQTRGGNATGLPDQYGV
jgi:hypothetical protein